MDRQLASVGVAICMLPLVALGCGPLLTTEPDPGTRFDQPVDGLSNGELGQFQRGQTEFRRGFTIAEGLGPVFNNVACAACHSGDGRGRPENILVRFSRGSDLIPGEGGPQLQERSIPGAAWESLPQGVDVSRRLPPPVFGMGLIEGIPDSEILAWEDPGDADGDGISGRANWVTPPAYVPADEPGGGAGPRLGRFGRKAQVSSLLQQTVEAYHQDIGISTPYRPTDNTNPQVQGAGGGPDRAEDPELGQTEVLQTVDYLRMLAPPAPGDWTEQRRRGETLFTTAGCASCHRPAMRTSPRGEMDDLPALGDRNVALYSDLLLHDMGDALADNRPDGSADGREWRTAPLWGLRIMREFLAGQMFLLHDGRARSVAEAIVLHGGEAAAARDSFQTMSAADRGALLDFVESR